MSLSHLATLFDRCKSPIDKETSRRIAAFFLPTLQRCGVRTGKPRPGLLWSAKPKHSLAADHCLKPAFVQGQFPGPWLCPHKKGGKIQVPRRSVVVPRCSWRLQTPSQIALPHLGDWISPLLHLPLLRSLQASGSLPRPHTMPSCSHQWPLFMKGLRGLNLTSIIY